jgi:transposase-like protein
MKKTRDGKRRFSREFKAAAVRRVIEGEALGAVARELKIGFELLWRWKKRVEGKGEEHLYGIGEHSEGAEKVAEQASQKRRIAELERLVGRQQLEIRFLDKALCRVEEQRQAKKSGGGAASSKR